MATLVTIGPQLLGCEGTILPKGFSAAVQRQPNTDEIWPAISSPSECHSEGGMNFEFIDLYPEKSIQSPQSVASIGPPHYSTTVQLFNFHKTTNLPSESKTSAKTEADSEVKAENANPDILPVDFSMSNLYGLGEVLSKSTLGPQKAEMVKTVENLRRVFYENSSCFSDSDTSGPMQSFSHSDADLLRYSEACFEDRCLVGTFLTRHAVDEVIQMSKVPGADKLATVFTDAIMAIGCYIKCFRDRLAPDSEARRNAQRRLIYLLGLYGTIKNSPSSLMKLQASNCFLTKRNKTSRSEACGSYTA
ncbi:uncharacterized protein LY79DRAFT_585147 [Colletotrichum navitas]|uniref:Uncharacterized protein n=1 Tax=Colletotrichum navitas TaxID=681940 RepID=A0AAD8PJL0_9PEZI|nr:uncharacterized protein LY79DRAFT_585147 [Colletotrichum navitas]KAK1565921.1 hypothetical protein LY79DRAFT_585147 [Colletotrichum navitas]